jgi:hypothetical protein
MYCPRCWEAFKKAVFLLGIVRPDTPHLPIIRKTLESLGIEAWTFDCDEEVKRKLLAPELPELLSVEELIKSPKWQELSLRKAITIDGKRFDTFESQTRFMRVIEKHHDICHGHNTGCGWIHESGTDRGYVSDPFGGPGRGAGPGDPNRWPFGLWQRKVDSRRFKGIGIDTTLLSGGRFALLMETCRPQDDKPTYLIEGLSDQLNIDACLVEYFSYDDEDTAYVRVSGGRKKRLLNDFVQTLIDKYSPGINLPVTRQ